MQHSYTLRTSRTILAAAASWMILAGLPAPLRAQTVVPLAPFRSVTLRGGGEVILRHGPTQRVTLLEGGEDCSRARIVDGDRLVIERLARECTRRHGPTVEVLTPEIAGLVVADGGTIQVRGGFPHQAEIEVAVHDGGTIDLRSLGVDRVNATVRHGGRIFTRPRRDLAASVSQGGNITYWENPRVRSSVRHGGVVMKGEAADAWKALVEFGPGAPPSVPALPDLPSIGDRGES